MDNVDVSAEDIEPPDSLPDLRRVVATVMRHAKVGSWDIAVVLCSDRFIGQLNETYRAKAGPTDVLSFPAGDETASGDIVISLDSVYRNAQAFDVPPDEELIRVAVHGALHLAGYAHDGVALGDADSLDNPMLQLQEKLVTLMMEEQSL